MHPFRWAPQSVAASGTLPFDPVPDTDLELEGHFYEPGNEPDAEILTVSPEYFRIMEIRLLARRTFTPQDIPGNSTALVINQSMAQPFWPGEHALRKRVVMKDWGPPLPGEIVGVESDVKQDSLATSTQPAIYYSFAQFSQSTLTTYVIVRCASDALSLAAAIRDQMWSVDRDQPVTVLPIAVMSLRGGRPRLIPWWHCGTSRPSDAFYTDPQTAKQNCGRMVYANPNLDETISRLPAFENAGADVLFAPRLPDLAAVGGVCVAVLKPVNFMVGIKGKSFSVAGLAAAGVRRISLATSLYRAAMTSFLDAAGELKDAGQFDFLNRRVTTPELNELMRI